MMDSLAKLNATTDSLVGLLQQRIKELEAETERLYARNSSLVAQLDAAMRIQRAEATR